MRISKLLSILLVSVTVFTGCARIPSGSNDASQVDETPISMIGITGNDLKSITKSDVMDIDDQSMLLGCQGLSAYVTGNFSYESGELEQIPSSERSDILRSYSFRLLTLLAANHQQAADYARGVADELESPGKDTLEFRDYKKACETYEAVLKNVQDFYVEPIKVWSGCWNNPSLDVSIEELFTGNWREIQKPIRVTKSDHCANSKFPYAAFFMISRASSYPSRVIRIRYVSNNGSKFENGKTTYIGGETNLLNVDSEIEF